MSHYKRGGWTNWTSFWDEIGRMQLILPANVFNKIVHSFWAHCRFSGKIFSACFIKNNLGLNPKCLVAWKQGKKQGLEGIFEPQNWISAKMRLVVTAVGRTDSTRKNLLFYSLIWTFAVPQNLTINKTLFGEQIEYCSHCDHFFLSNHRVNNGVCTFKLVSDSLTCCLCSCSKRAPCVWKSSGLGMSWECVHAHTHFTRSECKKTLLAISGNTRAHLHKWALVFPHGHMTLRTNRGGSLHSGKTLVAQTDRKTTEWIQQNEFNSLKLSTKIKKYI